MCFTMAPTLSTRFRNEKYFFSLRSLKLSQLRKKHDRFYLLVKHGVNVSLFPQKKQKCFSLCCRGGNCWTFLAAIWTISKIFYSASLLSASRVFFIVLSADISRLMNEIFASFMIFTTKFQFHKTRRFSAFVCANIYCLNSKCGSIKSEKVVLKLTAVFFLNLRYFSINLKVLIHSRCEVEKIASEIIFQRSR